MIKIISVIVLISTSIFAQNFDEFLNNALEKSPYLKAVSLGISQAKEQGKVLNRYENPSLEVEYSQFKEKIGNDANGYRMTLSQPVRLWGVGDTKEELSKAIIEKAKSKYNLNKAQLTYDISLAFIYYAQKKEFYYLGKKELEIVKRIYEISKERYKEGTISKGVVLQAQVDYEIAEVSVENRNLDSLQSYYQLIKLAGLSDEVELNYRYEFILKTKEDKINNPDLVFMKSLKDEYSSFSKLNSYSIEWIDLFAEYEDEPDQNIYRVGASLPLAVFNTKSQEKQIAKLEADKTQLNINRQRGEIKIENKRLQKYRVSLKELKLKNEQTLKTQEELLKMFEDGYKIANVNLLQLQNIKSKVIQTKESLIKIQSQLDINTITRNYIAGAYNE